MRKKPTAVNKFDAIAAQIVGTAFRQGRVREVPASIVFAAPQPGDLASAARIDVEAIAEAALAQQREQEKGAALAETVRQHQFSILVDELEKVIELEKLDEGHERLTTVDLPDGRRQWQLDGRTLITFVPPEVALDDDGAMLVRLQYRIEP